VTDATDGLGHQLARLTKHALPGEIVAETRRDGPTPGNEIGQFRVAQIQNAGRDHAQLVVGAQSLREPLWGADYSPDLQTPSEQLRQEQTPGGAGAAEKKHCHLLTPANWVTNLVWQ
jgi:hypothetical protein